ncbi:MAG: DUF3293 domain-containing protein [Wenzhouxiangellaceae bacterium]|nr:DUF3293 domain-containing protein [Wenzhouxiangellaceae bacterium]
MTIAPQNPPIDAFLATDYRVCTGERWVTAHIGRPCPALERAAGRPWCIITAHNPAGRRRSAQSNRAAAARLENRLRELDPVPMLPACNRDPAGRWPDEPGWLFAFRDPTQVRELAEEFGQLGVVAGQPSQPVELWLLDAPAGGELPPHVRVLAP